MIFKNLQIYKVYSTNNFKKSYRINTNFNMENLRSSLVERVQTLLIVFFYGKIVRDAYTHNHLDIVYFLPMIICAYRVYIKEHAKQPINRLLNERPVANLFSDKRRTTKSSLELLHTGFCTDLPAGPEMVSSSEPAPALRVSDTPDKDLHTGPEMVSDTSDKDLHTGPKMVSDTSDKKLHAEPEMVSDTELHAGLYTKLPNNVFCKKISILLICAYNMYERIRSNVKKYIAKKFERIINFVTNVKIFIVKKHELFKTFVTNVKIFIAKNFNSLMLCMFDILIVIGLLYIMPSIYTIFLLSLYYNIIRT